MTQPSASTFAFDFAGDSDAGTVLFKLSGELGSGAVATMREQIPPIVRRRANTGTRIFICDLASVTTCDMLGLSLLLALHNDCKDAVTRFRVVNARAPIEQLMRDQGFTKLFALDFRPSP